MIDVESLISKLQGVKPAGVNHWQALCPAHDDHTPSLSITRTPDKTLLFCHAGCTLDSIVSKLDITKADLYTNTTKAQSKFVASYDYKDATDTLQYRVLRYEPKSFSVKHPDGNGNWINGLNGKTSILYNLTSIYKAIQKGKTIYITEGEKDANTLISKGLTATTAPFGARSHWQDNYTESLQNAHQIIILPDNDTEGINRASKVAKALHNRVKSIKVINLPALNSHGDITDWLDAGHTLEELNDIIEQTPDFMPDCSVSFVFKDKGSAYQFTHTATNTIVTFTKLRQHRTTDTLNAQVLVKDNNSAMIHYQALNLLAPKSRETMAETLLKKAPGIDWANVVESICFQVIENFTKGEEAIEVWSDNSQNVEADYLLEPLIYKNEPTVFFGDGKVGKSYLAVALCILLTLPFLDNQLGLKPKKAKCLYLDYERSQKVFQNRLNALHYGFGVPSIGIHYRRCTIPFADEIETLQRLIVENNIDFIVIDSIGVACAGDLNSSEVATRFAQALHSLKVSSLLITHISKSEGSKSPIGSVYFRNLASNVFDVRKQQDVDADNLDIALFHDDNNLGKKLSPLGFHFAFNDNKTVLTSKDVGSIPAFANELPLQQQIAEVLKSGAMTAKEIADELGKNPNSIRVKLNQHKDKFIKKAGEKWSNIEKQQMNLA